METNTARNFAIQLGSLISLYTSLSAVIMVVFGVITIVYPNPTNMSWENVGAQEAIRFGIAMLIVFFPTYIVLTRFVNKIRREETGTYLVLTKWLVYLSLLVGGGILLGDFVATILTYLNGDITLRFILKALTLAFVIGTAFYYYIQDARMFWNTHEKQSIQYAAGAGVIVLCVLVLGFMHSDTPSKVRDIKIDEQEVSDLSDMQYRIEDSYRVNKSLPKDVASLYIGIAAPTAPAGREPYTYTATGNLTYTLCATFAYPSQDSANSGRIVAPVAAPDSKPLINPYNNWDHGAGKVCFERTITPDKTVN
jgi:hypothetical protein